MANQKSRSASRRVNELKPNRPNHRKKKSRRNKSGRVMPVVIVVAILLLIASILIFRNNGSGNLNPASNTTLNPESSYTSMSSSQPNKTSKPASTKLPTGTPKPTAKPTPTPVPITQDGVTLVQYNQLQTGMSIADVVELFGGVEGSAMPANTETTTITYRWDGSGSVGASITITFISDKLTAKSQEGLK